MYKYPLPPWEEFALYTLFSVIPAFQLCEKNFVISTFSAQHILIAIHYFLANYIIIYFAIRIDNMSVPLSHYLHSLHPPYLKIKSGLICSTVFSHIPILLYPTLHV